MRRVSPILHLLLSMLVLTGCVDFEEQTLNYRFDRENDRLLIFQLYRGIYADKGEEGPTEDEKEELNSVMSGERTFFFNNIFTEYNRAALQNTLTKASEKDQERPEQVKAPERAEVELFKAILASSVVANGAFFLCEDGRLCAYQYVTLSNASTLIPLANAYFTQHYLANPPDELEPGNQERVRAFAQIGAWLKLEDTRLYIREAQPFESYRSKTRAWGIDLKSSDIVFNYDEPFAEVIIGRRDQETGQLNGLRETGNRRNLTAYVQETYGIRESVDVNALRREFLETGAIPD